MGNDVIINEINQKSDKLVRTSDSKHNIVTWNLRFDVAEIASLVFNPALRVPSYAVICSLKLEIHEIINNSVFLNENKTIKTNQIGFYKTKK